MPMRKPKQIHIGTSPLTNRIYAGFPNAAGDAWLEAGRIDATGIACAAVAQHCIANGSPVVVYNNGAPAYEITARAIANEGKTHG